MMMMVMVVNSVGIVIMSSGLSMKVSYVIQ